MSLYKHKLFLEAFVNKTIWESMLPERFWVFKNTWFIKKKIEHQKVTSISQTRTLFWNLDIYCYYGDKKWNTEFFLIACFKENKNMAIEKNRRITINFYKKQCLRVIIWNKKHLTEQVDPITYILGIKIFAVATFEDLSVVSFQRKSKTWRSIN